MRSFHLLTCLLACLALPAFGDEEPPPTSSDPPGEASPAVTDDPAALPRVIIYPSRLRSIAGHVLSETPDKIKIRTLNNRVQEFDTSLIFSLVRLHDMAAPVPAVVLLHDGRRREGLLEEDAFDHVTLRIHEVSHEFKREDVAVVQLLPSFQEQYEWLQQQLDEDDPAAHLKLCEWLVKRDRLPEARTELEALIKTHDYELGRRLLRRVNARIELESSKAVGNKPDNKAPPHPNDMPDLVSEADVNLVRVYEVDLDNPPKIRIPTSTIRTLLDRYGDSELIPQDKEGRIAFAKADPAIILEIMFALRARDLYGQVKVLGEPATLSTFRTRIHDTWLLNSCGSLACHGGPPERAGRFRLHWSHRPNNQLRTSNLLALNRLEIDGRQMLNWTKPEDSLLYQHALPRSEATRPHPEVDGWKPVFTPGASAVHEAYQAWVRDMIRHHHRDWPVKYQPWTPVAPVNPQDPGEDAGKGPTR